MNHPQMPQMCCLSCFFVGEDLRQIPDLVSKNCVLGACARAGKWMEVLNSELHVCEGNPCDVPLGFLMSSFC